MNASKVPVPGKAGTTAANFENLRAKVAQPVDTATPKRLLFTFVGSSWCVVRYGTSWCEIRALHRISALCTSSFTRIVQSIMVGRRGDHTQILSCMEPRV